MTPPQGRSLAGWTLRAALGVLTAALLAAAMAAAGTAFGSLAVLVVVAAAALTALFPDSPAPTLACVLAVIIYIAGDPGMGIWLVLTASLVHTVHALAGLAEVVPARARAGLSAIVPTLRRWALTQVVTVPPLAVLAVIAG